jgi:hypothetical protein
MAGNNTSGFPESLHINQRSTPHISESQNLRIGIRGNRSPSLDGVSFLEMLASSKEFASLEATSNPIREIPPEAAHIHEAVTQGDAKRLEELLKKHAIGEQAASLSAGKGGKNDQNESVPSSTFSPPRSGKGGVSESRSKRVLSSIIDAQDPFGNTPLMRAAAHVDPPGGASGATTESNGDNVSVAMIEMLQECVIIETLKKDVKKICVSFRIRMIRR